MRDDLTHLVKALPRVRESFRLAGFTLPDVYLAAVEAQRVRPADEFDYAHFLDEVARESFVLPYPWQPAIRHLLKFPQRSAYLDLLASKSEQGALSLDPNFNAFLSGDAGFQMLKEFRRSKALDMDAHLHALRDLLSSTKSLADRIAQLAEQLGFSRVGARTQDAGALLFNASADPSISLRVVDLPALRKNGDVVVQYLFSTISSRPFGMEVFLPGANIYCNGNSSQEAVLFSFYVQCLFALNLIDARIA